MQDNYASIYKRFIQKKYDARMLNTYYTHNKSNAQARTVYQ